MDDILSFIMIENNQGVSMSVKSSTLNECVYTERRHANDDFMKCEVKYFSG